MDPLTSSKEELEKTKLFYETEKIKLDLKLNSQPSKSLLRFY